MSKPKTFDDLTEAQQRACHVFCKQYGLMLDDIAAYLNTFFKLAHGEMTVMQAEEATGLVIIDRTHPTLF